VTDTTRYDTGIADVNGATLVYDVAGQGHPLVMIHGGLVDRHLWDDQFDVFAQQYRAIRYDVRGYGESSTPTEPYAHHEDLRSLLTFLGVESAYVLGLSMGGGIAIDFTLAYPAMVDALIPVAAGLPGYAWSESLAEQGAAIQDAFSRGDVPHAVELMTRMWTDGPRRTPAQVDPGVRERVRRMTTAMLARPKDEAEPQPLDPAAIARLADIHTPTLVIIGDQDIPDCLAIAALLETGITGARKVVLPGTAHHLNMERPAEFNRIVLDFLRTL
jgi:3-oxoadipate enol-lactonase